MVYQWITLAGVVICLPLAVVAWRTRPSPGATPLVGVLLAIVVWNGCQFLAMLVESVPWTIAFIRLHLVGVTLVVPATLVLAIEYVGREELLTPRLYALLGVEPVLVNVLLWTNESHGLFLGYVPLGSPAAADSSFRDFAVTGVIPVDPGPAFWVHAAYLWVLTVVALLVVAWTAVRRRDIYRGQLSLLAAGIVVPLVTSILDNLDVAPVRLTEAGFVASGALLAVAVTRYDFGDLTPVARATVLGRLSSGILVVDRENRITDCNPAVRRLLDLGESGVIGSSLEDTFGHLPDVYERYATASAGEETVTVDTDAGTRYYRVQVSPLTDRRGRQLGRVFLVDDVTERAERQAKLERQKERFERFASVVSHDLRNPLQVADGRRELAAMADDPSEHLEQIEASHERMETIIDDVLTMAREGQTIADPSTTTLAAVAEDAWAQVDTPEATLRNGLTGTVAGDRRRLQRVFENLFRNALEHGRPTVTVTTGIRGGDADNVIDPAARGFFVADDGPGIPESERDRVFESGYTDSDDGTGLGLGIVASIVEAHGWDIEATESEQGGARFEITGVDSLDPDADTDERRD